MGTEQLEGQPDDVLMWICNTHFELTIQTLCILHHYERTLA
jgi:hypothetical protein